MPSRDRPAHRGRWSTCRRARPRQVVPALSHTCSTSVALYSPVVKEFISELKARGLAAKTIANTALVLRLVLQEAVEAGSLRENPATNLRLPKARRQEPKFLTADEVNALAAAARPPYGFLILFAAYTGLRPSELCGLRVGKLDLLRRRAEVSETLMQINGEAIIGPTKSDAVSSVPIPVFLRDAAGEYLALRRHELGRPLAPDDLVFPPITTKNGVARTEYLYAESLRRYILKPALAAARLPSDFRTHDLRHTCASLLISLGAHPKAIMERLGHSDITVTPTSMATSSPRSRSSSPTASTSSTGRRPPATTRSPPPASRPATSSISVPTTIGSDRDPEWAVAPPGQNHLKMRRFCHAG